jgi:leucyl-tRNA synthetase
MFMGPFDQGGDFRDTAMEGMSRWVNRIRKIGLDLGQADTKSPPKIVSALQKLIMKVSDDLEKRRYNTAIASMMEFTNLIADEGHGIGLMEFLTFLQLVAPFAPHMTEDLWQQLHRSPDKSFTPAKSIHTQLWPAPRQELIREEAVVIAVQVNGKLRDTVSVDPAEAVRQEAVETFARGSEKVQRYISGQTILKVIFVPGRLLNFVVRG